MFDMLLQDIYARGDIAEVVCLMRESNNARNLRTAVVLEYILRDYRAESAP